MRIATLGTPTYIQSTPPQKPANEAPKDGFQPGGGPGGDGPNNGSPLKNGLIRFAKIAVPAGLGVYAGLSSGWGAAALGAFAVAPACGVIGAIVGGVAAEKVFGTSGSATAGAAIAGGIVGLAAGAITGGVIGYAGGHPAAAVGLGLLGATTGLLNAATHQPKKD